MKINSNFKINKIVRNYLNEINGKQRILKKGNQISEKQWQKIISINLLKSSLYSAKVEGNPLEIQDISRLSIKKREHLEVRNIIRALKYIKKNIHVHQKITVKFIARLHAITMNRIDENAGKIRTKQNAIFNQEGYVVYMPPPPAEVQKLLKKLIKYVNSNKHQSPLIKAIISHFIFEKIHPFIDGNGRVGRLLIHAILKIEDSDILRAVSFEEELNRTKDEYYALLDRQNSTYFVEYMLKTISSSFDNIIEKIVTGIHISSNLLPRREEIFNIIKDHKVVTMDFIKRRFQEIPERTLRHDFADLVRRKLIVKLGKTRGAVYRIKN